MTWNQTKKRDDVVDTMEVPAAGRVEQFHVRGEGPNPIMDLFLKALTIEWWRTVVVAESLRYAGQQNAGAEGSRVWDPAQNVQLSTGFV